MCYPEMGCPELSVHLAKGLLGRVDRIATEYEMGCLELSVRMHKYL